MNHIQSNSNMPGPAATHAPRVSFALLAFNQQAFIADAVQAALAQDCAPLEIILSDDHSSDDTFAIIEQLAAAYRGPHTVRINRNPANLGIGAHINQVVGMSHGDLLVMAAGDDISEPERVAVLTRRWLEAGQPAAMASRSSVINQYGHTVSPLYRGYDGQYPQAGESLEASLLHHVRDGSRHIPGCTAAYSRHTFEHFGPFRQDVVNEDNVMSFRSWLLSGVCFTDEVLVRYRTHQSSLYNRSQGHVLTTRRDFADAEARTQRNAQWEAAYLAQHLDDLQCARDTGLRSPQLLDEVESVLQQRLRRARLVAEWSKLSIPSRLLRLLRLRKQAPTGFIRARLARLCLACHCTGRAMIRHTLDGLRNLRAARKGAQAEP